MNLHIAGMGWVTPLGCGVETVWNRLLRGDAAVPQEISDCVSKTSYPVFRVPADALKHLSPHPRLRRASAISRFAAAAGLDALAEAKKNVGEIDVQRTALVLAISNGGVVYTKRFYSEIVQSGAQSASPLLFPETVFNAPASHLAAILGITGTSYTLVGDGAVGVLALKMADDLLLSDMFDSCLVVGAEEADWILCDAYRKWRLTRSKPPIELFRRPAGGTILSEGAGAILLSREGAIKIDTIDAGGNFSRQRDAARILEGILYRLKQDASDQCIICSANGTFVDLAEVEAIAREMPAAIVYSFKSALGESVGASALWQTIAAAEALRTKRLPKMPESYTVHALRFPSRREISFNNAIVLSCGLNHQAAGLRLSI